MKNKWLSIGICVINAIGIVCLIYCAVLYLSHSTYVVNPDAMLPMANWERGGMMLTIGVIPMLIANIIGFKFVKNGTSMVKRLLFFIPSILEIVLVLNFWIR